MKRSVLLGILGLCLCVFFAGCHTLDMLSQVKAGHTDLKDAYRALAADDKEFQQAYW